MKSIIRIRFRLIKLIKIKLTTNLRKKIINSSSIIKKIINSIRKKKINKIIRKERN